MMKPFLLLPIATLCFATSVGAEQYAPYPMPRSQVVPVEDTERDRRYELYIKLPEDYDANAETPYPVIYTTDAKWHMDMLSGAAEYLVPNAILVGISWQFGLEDELEFVSRFRDYKITPYEDADRQARLKGGQVTDHLDFLRDDVIPLVEDKYHVDPEQRTYFSYSLGSQFGIYTLLTKPDTFNNYILGSPSFSEDTLGTIKTLKPKSSDVAPANVFVSVGELEDRLLGVNEQLVDYLEDFKPDYIDLDGLEIIEGGNHGTAFPETVIEGLKWMAGLSEGDDPENEL